MFIIEEEEEKREVQKERALKLARFYNEEGLYKDAVRSFELYIFLQGKESVDYSIYKEMGVCYSLLGKNSEAILRLEKAYSLNSESDKVIYLLAQMHEQTGNYDKAEEYYKKIIGLEGAEVVAVNYSLGGIELRKGEREKAISYFEKVIEIEPTNGHAYYTLGEIYYQKDELKTAENYFKQAHENGIKRVSVYDYLGHISLKQGNIENAKINFLVAAGKEQWNGVHYKNYLKCLSENEIAKEKRVMEELKDYDLNFFRLGLIELHKGNFEKAKTIFVELETRESSNIIKKSIRDELNEIQYGKK